MATLPAGSCKVCGTPLLYRFLLAVVDSSLEISPGTLVAGRFFVQSHRLWLDTRPETPTPAPEHVPASVMPYLKLFHLAQHVPRPYAYLTPEQSGLESPLLLLDMAPIAVQHCRPGDRPDQPAQIKASLLPSLYEAWARGSGLQQLNWLRQIAALWPELAAQRVVRTLLKLEDLRVDGALLRLTQLIGDGPLPTLAELGHQWEGLLVTAQPAVAPYLRWLVSQLRTGDLASATELVAELEGAIQALAEGLRVTVDWAADTDQGTTRDRNEDACYPMQETRQRHLTSASGADTPPLLLVCDGIGGHEQGNVASETAIKLIQQELEPLGQLPNLSPGAIAQRLKQALILANDAISTRNNDENRSARARMGTTVVLALVHFPYVSIAHIGDSRAYRISPHTCYQLTVDDDVASREAQLGYALYSEAVQLPSGGALIQALGISDSGHLYPAVQHLLIDDAAVLLLCSDGLSDYDRVDALGPQRVAPLVTADSPLGNAVADLIAQANRLNGHDNITVGLMRFRPQPAPLPTLPGHSLKAVTGPADTTSDNQSARTRIAAPAEIAVAPVRPSFAWLPFLGGMAAVLAILGAGALALGRRQPGPVALLPLGSQWPTVALSGQPLPGAALAATVDVPVGSFWQVAETSDQPLQLLGQPEVPLGASATPPVATGSILRVVSRQTTADNTAWVRLRVCSIPSGASLDQRPQETATGSNATGSDATGPEPPGPDLNQQLSAPGDEGWVQTRQLYGATAFLELVTPDQADRCVP